MKHVDRSLVEQQDQPVRTYILVTAEDTDYAVQLKICVRELSRAGNESVVLIDPYTRHGLALCRQLGIACPSRLPAFVVPSQSGKVWYTFLPNDTDRVGCRSFAASCKDYVEGARGDGRTQDPPAMFFRKPHHRPAQRSALDHTNSTHWRQPVCVDIFTVKPTPSISVKNAYRSHTDLVHRVSSAARDVGALHSVPRTNVYN
jgi:hypothetical protein